MQLADTHCHLDMAAFDADRWAVVERAAQVGVARLLLPALDVRSANHILALAEAHEQLFAAIGIHPTEVDEGTVAGIPSLHTLAVQPKVVAIGEIGLDYYWVTDKSGRARQRQALQAQLELASEAEKPVVLHMREENDDDAGSCAEDMLGILRDWIRDLRNRNDPLGQRPGVMHSFSGTEAVALQAIDLGFCVGVTGPITFGSAERRRQVVRALPLDRLLIETDSPFLAPQPHRGHRNEPAYVVHIADRIAQVQSRTVGEVANATTANAARLFAWGVSV